MNLTDTWLNSFQVTGLFFLYMKTAKAKQEGGERGVQIETTDTCDREMLYKTFFECYRILQISPKIQWRKAIQWFHGNCEGSYQLMLKKTNTLLHS